MSFLTPFVARVATLLQEGADHDQVHLGVEILVDPLEVGEVWVAACERVRAADRGVNLSCAKALEIARAKLAPEHQPALVECRGRIIPDITPRVRRNPRRLP